MDVTAFFRPKSLLESRYMAQPRCLYYKLSVSVRGERIEGLLTPRATKRPGAGNIQTTSLPELHAPTMDQAFYSYGWSRVGPSAVLN